MKKIGWLAVAVFTALFLFVETTNGQEKETSKKEIDELIQGQINVFQILFNQNQRISQILNRMFCVDQNSQKQPCKELEKMRKMVKMANKDLLEAIELINGLHGKDKEAILENLFQIEAYLRFSFIKCYSENFLAGGIRKYKFAYSILYGNLFPFLIFRRIL